MARFVIRKKAKKQQERTVTVRDSSGRTTTYRTDASGNVDLRSPSTREAARVSSSQSDEPVSVIKGGVAINVSPGFEQKLKEVTTQPSKQKVSVKGEPELPSEVARLARVEEKQGVRVNRIRNVTTRLSNKQTPRERRIQTFRQQVADQKARDAQLQGAFFINPVSRSEAAQTAPARGRTTENVGRLLLRNERAFTPDPVKQGEAIQFFRGQQAKFQNKVSASRNQPLQNFIYKRALLVSSIPVGAGESLDAGLYAIENPGKAAQSAVSGAVSFAKNPIAGITKGATSFIASPERVTGEFVGGAILTAPIGGGVFSAGKGFTKITAKGLSKAAAADVGKILKLNSKNTRIIIQQSQAAIRKSNRNGVLRITIPETNIPKPAPVGRPRVAVNIENIRVDKTRTGEVIRASGKAVSDGRVFRVKTTGVEAKGIGRQVTEALDDLNKKIRAETSIRNVDKQNIRFAFSTTKTGDAILRAADITKYTRRGKGQISRTLGFDFESGVFLPRTASTQILRDVKPEKFTVPRKFSGATGIQFINPERSAVGFSLTARSRSLFSQREIQAISKQLQLRLSKQRQNFNRSAGTVTTQQTSVVNVSAIQKLVQQAQKLNTPASKGKITLRSPLQSNIQRRFLEKAASAAVTGSIRKASDQRIREQNKLFRTLNAQQSAASQNINTDRIQRPSARTARKNATVTDLRINTVNRQIQRQISGFNTQISRSNQNTRPTTPTPPLPPAPKKPVLFIPNDDTTEKIRKELEKYRARSRGFRIPSLTGFATGFRLPDTGVPTISPRFLTPRRKRKSAR